MNILKFDSHYTVEEIQYIYQKIKEALPNNDLIAIPTDMDLLIDCDTYHLTYIRDQIDNAIRQKEIMNEM